MWPGQQPPGGGQNPQDQNPYQQPGYQPPGYPPPGFPHAGAHPAPGPYQQPQQPQQPNPYQQPPHPQQPLQPNPYQEPGGWGPGAAGWQAPAGPPGPPKPPRGGRKRTATLAIVAAVAVVAAAVVTGVVVLGKDDGGKSGAPGARRTSTPSSQPPATEDTVVPEDDNPRTGGGEETDIDPVIPGWQVVVNPKRHSAFDVPPGWTVKGSSWSTGFSDDKDKSGLKSLVAMSSPAYADEDYCTYKHKDGYEDSTALAGTGTKGAQGAGTQAEAAKSEALNWAFAAYDQGRTGDLRLVRSEVKPFKSDHGLSGYAAKAVVTGVKKSNKCSTDGKAFAVSYTDTEGDFATWVLYAAKGVKDEVPDATIKKIMSSLRPLKRAS